MSNQFNLDSMRVPYRSENEGFDTFQFSSKHPIKQFKLWFKYAAENSDVKEANKMVLSTCNKLGIPSSRYVLLKGLDDRGFHFYTSSLSRKGQNINENPNVSLLFYWEPLNRQVRIDGIATVLPDSEAVSYFSSRPKKSQIAAYVSTQSSPIPINHDYLQRRYSDAEKKFELMDTIPKPSEWCGYVVLPHTIEFWQGKSNRLHDRIVFYQPGADKQASVFSEVGEDNWVFERLSP